MASKLQSMFARSGRSNLLRVGGESATYDDGETEPVTVTVVEAPKMTTEEQDPDQRGRRVRREKIVGMSTDPNNAGVANPKVGAKLTLANGEVWIIRQPPAVSASVAILSLRRSGPSEISRPGAMGN